MSSPEVRQAINDAVAAASSVPVYDLSDYLTLDEVLGSINSKAFLVQYVTAGERFASVGSPGSAGWEEDGAVVVHYMVPSGFDSTQDLADAEAVRLQLRGQRVSPSVTIESMDPFTDFGGDATGLYGAAFKGYAANIYYVNRTCG